ncbi:MAG: DUF1844 domain-containing protein [Planctomycetaceae bacterium]|nr:DUF1844 domain-containing protein [Planctomycetaceae bacterium]
MEDTHQEHQRPDIKSDEDWKAQVKAEDARLDAERSRSAEKPRPTAEPDSPPFDPTQLPKPTFGTLVGLFSTQAMVALGLISHPEDGKVEVQLPLARHFIDLLGVLEEKSQGNLSPGETQLLEQSLHDLRMAYLELSRSR